MNQHYSTSEPASDAPSTNRVLSLDALRTFAAICETGSFRRAAARVHRSASAVSLQVTKLEATLDAQLLHRNARRVSLTEEGEALLGYARRLLAISDEAVARFRGSPLAGRLHLAAPHDLGVSLVPTLLKRLATAHPGIAVDVRLDASEAVQRAFRDGRANLALFNEGNTPPMPARDLFSEPLAWLMWEGGRAVERDPLPLAVAEVGCGWRGAALEALERAGRPYRIAYASDTSMGQVAALRADLAVAALPRSLAGRGLVEIPSDCGLPALPRTHVWFADDGSALAASFAATVTPDLWTGLWEGTERNR